MTIIERIQAGEDLRETATIVINESSAACGHAGGRPICAVCSHKGECWRVTEATRILQAVHERGRMAGLTQAREMLNSIREQHNDAALNGLTPANWQLQHRNTCSNYDRLIEQIDALKAQKGGHPIANTD